MARFKFSARTMMLAGGGLMLAPLLMIYVVLGRIQGGVSPAAEMFGHFDRYWLQAEIGGFVLAVGVVLRLVGLCVPQRDQAALR
ncbi:MAG: hypothetical protein QM667_00235 [Asticcacaulis sp.]